MMMHRRNNRFTPVVIALGAILFTGYGYYIYSNQNNEILTTNMNLEKCKSNQKIIKEQLKVVYKHTSKLEEALKKEKENHLSANQEYIAKMRDFELNITKSKHEAMNRFNALDTNFKMLKANYDELSENHVALQQQYVRLSDDHKRVTELAKQDYENLKSSKETESFTLQGRIQELFNAKVHFQEEAKSNREYYEKSVADLKVATNLAEDYLARIKKYESELAKLKEELSSCRLKAAQDLHDAELARKMSETSNKTNDISKDINSPANNESVIEKGETQSIEIIKIDEERNDNKLVFTPEKDGIDTGNNLGNISLSHDMENLGKGDEVVSLNKGESETPDLLNKRSVADGEMKQNIPSVIKDQNENLGFLGFKSDVKDSNVVSNISRSFNSPSQSNESSTEVSTKEKNDFTRFKLSDILRNSNEDTNEGSFKHHPVQSSALNKVNLPEEGTIHSDTKEEVIKSDVKSLNSLTGIYDFKVKDKRDDLLVTSTNDTLIEKEKIGIESNVRNIDTNSSISAIDTQHLLNVDNENKHELKLNDNLKVPLESPFKRKIDSYNREFADDAKLSINPDETIPIKAPVNQDSSNDINNNNHVLPLKASMLHEKTEVSDQEMQGETKINFENSEADSLRGPLNNALLGNQLKPPSSQLGNDDITHNENIKPYAGVHNQVQPPVAMKQNEIESKDEEDELDESETKNDVEIAHDNNESDQEIDNDQDMDNDNGGVENDHEHDQDEANEEEENDANDGNKHLKVNDDKSERLNVKKVTLEDDENGDQNLDRNGGAAAGGGGVNGVGVEMGAKPIQHPKQDSDENTDEDGGN